jgi:hypothetical protein
MPDAAAGAAEVGVGPTEMVERNVKGADQLEVYRPDNTSDGHLQ